MKIQTGGMELLESSAFLALGLGETVIEVGKDKETLKFILNFTEAKGAPKLGMKSEATDKKTLKLTLTNWDNPLGTTLIEPLEVGTYEMRRLFFRSSSVRPERRGKTEM